MSPESPSYKLFRIGFEKLGLCGRAGNGQHAEQNGQPLRDLPRHKMSRMKGLTPDSVLSFKKPRAFWPEPQVGVWHRLNRAQLRISGTVGAIGVVQLGSDFYDSTILASLSTFRATCSSDCIRSNSRATKVSTVAMSLRR